jgi:hypothetical protein
MVRNLGTISVRTGGRLERSFMPKIMDVDGILRVVRKDGGHGRRDL